ncbi:MAG: hypothetical protein ACWA40_00560 [Planktomarina sp.]
MTLDFVLYFSGAFAALIWLTYMIVNIGSCPHTAQVARVTAKVVSVGFAGIGLGGVILGAAALPAFEAAPKVGLLIGLGFVCLCLGLGFTQAMANIRRIVDESKALNAIEV